MKTLLCVFLLSTALLCVSAQTTPAASPATPEANVAKAEEMATLVFYRPKRFTGSGLTPSVFLNGEQLARLDNGRFFVVRMAPGSYKIESTMKHDPLQLEVKAGKVQYLEMVILAGSWRGGGRIIPTGASDGHLGAKKLKPLDKKWAVSDRVSFLLPEEKAGE